MPDISMLQNLADALGVTVTELLEGRRIEAPELRAQKAEEHLTEALAESETFGLNDRIAYFRHKWLREHRGFLAMTVLAYFASLTALWVWERQAFPAAAAVLGITIWSFARNRMMTYVEKRAFRQ